MLNHVNFIIMKCNILLIGFGVIGTEALSKIVKDYNGKKILKRTYWFAMHTDFKGSLVNLL